MCVCVCVGGRTAQVFDEVCVELAMALLQLLQWAPAEEQLWRAVRALARFADHSADVPQLVAMIGPDPAAFRSLFILSLFSFPTIKECNETNERSDGTIVHARYQFTSYVICY